MSKPLVIANTFQTQTGPIPLSELDVNFGQLAASINDFGTYGNYLVDSSGAANAITVTAPVGSTFVYTAGVPLQVQIANTTTSSAVNVNVNGLGAKAVINADGSTPIAGQFVAGQILDLQYDGTSFRVLNPIGGSAVPAAFGNLTLTGRLIFANAIIATIEMTTFGGGAATASVFQLFSDNNIYIDPPSSGTPTGGAIFFRRGASATTFSISAAGNVLSPPPASGISFTAQGLANQPTAQMQGSSTSGQSLGMLITAGTTSADYALDVVNSTNTTAFFLIRGDGGILVANPAGGDQGLGTINIQNGLYIAGNPVYAGIPINSVTGAYGTVLSDANKCIKQNGAGTITIAANSSVAYPLGTAITFANRTGSAISIAITTDTLVFAVNNATGTRTLGSNGLATAIKTDTTVWLISGANLT